MLLGEPTQVSWKLLGESAEFENWGSDRDEEGRWVLEQSGVRYIYIYIFFFFLILIFYYFLEFYLIYFFIQQVLISYPFYTY